MMNTETYLDVMPPVYMAKWKDFKRSHQLIPATRESLANAKNFDAIENVFSKSVNIVIAEFSEEYRHILIWYDKTKYLEDEFTITPTPPFIVTHNAGPGGSYVWSRLPFQTYMGIYRWGQLEQVYRCEKQYVLIAQQFVDDLKGLTVGLISQYSTPIETGPIPPLDKDNCTELFPMPQSNAVDVFCKEHIWDITSQDVSFGPDHYDCVGWDYWLKNVRERKPELSGKEGPWEHIIIIGSKTMMREAHEIWEKIEEAETETEIDYWFKRPHDVFIIKMSSEKQGAKVYRHHKAFVQLKISKSPEKYTLVGFASSKKGPILNTDNCAEVRQYGRTKEYQLFLKKHLLDPDSWEAAAGYGLEDWTMEEWIMFYRARKNHLHFTYRFDQVYSLILISEKKLRELLHDDKRPTTEQYNGILYHWIDEPVYTVFYNRTKEHKDQNLLYSTYVLKCSPLYVSVTVREENGENIPIHFHRISFSKSLDPTETQGWSLSKCSAVHKVPADGWLGQRPNSSGAGAGGQYSGRGAVGRGQYSGRGAVGRGQYSGRGAVGRGQYSGRGGGSGAQCFQLPPHLYYQAVHGVGYNPHMPVNNAPMNPYSVPMPVNQGWNNSSYYQDASSGQPAPPFAGILPPYPQNVGQLSQGAQFGQPPHQAFPAQPFYPGSWNPGNQPSQAVYGAPAAPYGYGAPAAPYGYGVQAAQYGNGYHAALVPGDQAAEPGQGGQAAHFIPGGQVPPPGQAYPGTGRGGGAQQGCYPDGTRRNYY